jgi:DNA-binding MarR family transcriptional regulator
MDSDRVERINRIMSCSEALVHGFNPGRDLAWMTCDLTMPQLKALIYVTKNEGATSGQIANKLGVGLSTVTGIVDRLIEQEMVSRREDPRDRRITRVQATPNGRVLVEDLLQYRNEVVTAILSKLDPNQLETVESAFQYLLDAAASVALERQRQEVVA